MTAPDIPHTGREEVLTRHRPDRPSCAARARAGQTLGLVMAVMLSAVLPASGAVETALIVSRDDPDRLVLAHWPRNGWVVTRNAAQTTILFPGEHLDIEPSRSLSSRLEGRIERLNIEQTPNGTRLVLDFGCDCFAALRRDGPSRLSIELLQAGTGGISDAGVPGPATAVSPLPVPRPTRPRPSPKQGADSDGGTDLAAVRRRLIGQLERAAAAGLITLEDQGRTALQDELPADAPRQELGSSRAKPMEQPGGAGPTPLTAARPEAEAQATRVAASSNPQEDRDVPRDPGTLPDGSKPARQDPIPACPPEAALSLSSSSEGGASASAIGRLRRELLGEFDAAAGEGAIALARFYLGNALLAEADLVLARFAPDGVEKSVLEALSKIIGVKPGTRASGLGKADCGPLHALWQAAAAASDGRPRKALTLMRQGGERSLQTLRGSLRDRIAVRMARAALTVGDDAAADRYLSLAMRGSLPTEALASSVERLAARMARRSGDVTEAVQRLRRVWGRFPGDPESGEALIQLAEMILDGEIAAAGDTRTLRLDLGALALAARGTPTGARAIVAEAGLAAQAFGRPAGLDLLALARRQQTLSEESYAEAVRDLSDETFARPGGTPLALLFEREPARYRPVLGDQAFRTALALSYAEIGLPDKGRDVLDDVDLAQSRVARALARAYLDEGRAEAARQMAEHLPPGTMRAGVVAETLEMQGRPGEALAQLVGAGAGPAADRARLAWAAGAWDRAAEALAEQMEISPRPDIAARLAVARQRAAADRAAAPAEGAPRTETASTLPPTPEPAFTPTAKGVAGYLEFMKAETEAIREVLGDG